MPKKTVTTDDVTPASTATALAEAPVTALAAPAQDTRGLDGVDGADDITFPRLALAQKTSPQLDPSRPDKYIEGLKLFQMFNSLTGENFGNGPVKFVVIRSSKRAMQFDAQNNIVDFNVPLDDPRLQFTTGPNGERIKPVATLFREYLVGRLTDDGEVEPLVLSFKGTQHGVARELNSWLVKLPKPIWSNVFELRSTSKQKGGFTTAAFTVRYAGKADASVALDAERWYESTERFFERVDRRDQGEGGNGPAPLDDSDVPF